MCCRESDYPDGVDQHCLEREVEGMVKTPPNSEEVVQEFLLQLVGFVPEYDCAFGEEIDPEEETGTRERGMWIRFEGPCATIDMVTPGWEELRTPSDEELAV